MNPIDVLIERSSLKCTLCGRAKGDCFCWVHCSCGWYFQRGAACNNPETKRCSGKINWRAYAEFMEIPKRQREAARQKAVVANGANE